MTDKTLVERLRARHVRSLLTNRMDPDPLAIQAAARIEALEKRVAVAEYLYRLADQHCTKLDARIEALEAALQEADPHNAMLPPEGADHG